MFWPPCRSALLRSYGVRPQFNPARYYASLGKRKMVEKDFDNMSIEEQSAHMEKFTETVDSNRTVDIWSMGASLLDVHVPSSVFSSRLGSLSLSSRMNNLKDNLMNHVKNALSMYELAKLNSFPDVRVKRSLSLNLLKVSSTSDKAWVAPLRSTFADTYVRVSKALAENDEKTLKKLTISGYRSHVLSLLKQRIPNHRYVWKLHSHVNPVKIVSLRAVAGYLAEGEPKIGNRLMIHALVRFDTLQTLEVYSKRGDLLSPPSSTPRRVTEYLAFERKMWYDTPWLIKEQL